MQKKLLPAFIPPRIVKGAGGWFILWYEQNPATGDLERFRKTFSLNRIPNKAQRADRARVILQEISRALAAGGYIFTGQEPAGQPFTPIGQALDLAISLKMEYERYDTRKTYRSISGIFRQWLEDEKMIDIPIMRFGKREAMAFMDYLQLRRRVGDTTYNNYQTILKVLFNELRARDFIQVNPWEQVPKKRFSKKRRRNFTEQERRTVAAWIAKENPGLFLGVLLSYYCFIRPGEMRKMQIRCIDIEDKVIRMPAAITKTQKDRTVTIPEVILPALATIVEKYHPDRYLFGTGLSVGRSPANKNTFYNHHRKALQQLFKAGLIKSISGLSFYSWKDSGLTDMSESISVLDLMKQAGHHDPKITLRYIHERAAKNIQEIKREIY